jgi:hypothetical protein
MPAPLVEATRKQFRQQLASKEAEYAQKEEELRKQREEIVKARETIDDQVAQRLKNERTLIAAVEGKKAQEAAAAKIETKSKELTELRQILT